MKPQQFFSEILQDARYTLRLWVSAPWYAGFAIAALAIGIGANTGVFSVVDTLLLRSLPFREPERLALFRQFIPPHDTVQQFSDWRQKSPYLEDSALTEEGDVNLGGTRLGTRAHIAQTSWNFFSVLGVHPLLGAGFMADEEIDGTGWGLPGSNSVAVIGYGLWQQLFAGDPRVLGRTIKIDGIVLTIVGVAPPGFDYPGRAVLWKPAALSPGNNGWSAVARIKPGLSWSQARAAFDVEVKRRSSEQALIDSASVRPSLTSLQDGLVGPVKAASRMFMGAVLLVLMLACMNVANLLIARTADRVTEMSIRSALGASHWRLTRQLLTECLSLCLVATLLGYGIAYWIVQLALTVAPPPLGAQSYSILDGHVLAFSLTLSVTTALLLGLLPSFYVSRGHAFRSRGSTRTRRSRRVQQVLVCAQVMITVILLSASVCLGRAFARLMKTDRGYDVKGVVAVSVSLDGTAYQLNKRQLPYFEEVLDRLRALPGVRSASATEFLPLYASAFVGGSFGVDGRPANLNSTMLPVLAGYFQTMGGRILYGREFTEGEVRSSAQVAVVNERFAAGFGAPRNILGHQLTSDDPPRKIIGVVRGMEYETDPSLENSNQVFIPSTAPGSFSSTFVVRVDGRAEDHLAAIRDTIQSLDPQVPVFGVATMEQKLDEVFAAPKFYRTAIAAFAAFTLLLAILGIYSTVTYAVVERTKEMGIRMALGSTPTRLRCMLLWNGLLMVATGAILGIASAQLTGHLLDHLMEGAQPLGLAASGSLILLFACVASASIWVATRRIATFDIVAIFRAE